MSSMFLVSCVVTRIEDYGIASSEEPKYRIVNPLTKSGVLSVTDSLHYTYLIQNNQKISLLNMIVLKEGKFILTIGKNDAERIGITKENYDWAISTIEKMNCQHVAEEGGK